jgi:hypothetical protein
MKGITLYMEQIQKSGVKHELTVIIWHLLCPLSAEISSYNRDHGDDQW